MLFTSLCTVTLALALGALASAVPAPAPPETRQDGTTITVQLEHSTLNAIRTVTVPLTGVPVAVDPWFTANIVDAACTGGCRIGFHCSLLGPAAGAGGPPIQVGPGRTTIIFDAFANITAVSCDLGLPAAEEEAQGAAHKTRKTRQTGADVNAPQGSVVFTSQDVVYEADLVLNELVQLPEYLVPVVFTDATVVLTHDPRRPIWSCHAYARGREENVDLGVFWVNTKFVDTFEGGLVFAWECAYL